MAAIVASGFVLLLLVIYGRSLGNGFVALDDPGLILDNPVSHGLSRHTIAAAFTSFDPELYIPLTFVSYQVDYLIGGVNPFIYHLTNLLLHACNALLVTVVLWRLTRRRALALFAGLVFAVHPLNVEAVAWAAARKDVLSAFFALLTIVAYLQYRDRHAGRWYAWSLAAFLAALLSKVSVLLLPFALLSIDWYGGRTWSRRAWIEKLPFFLLSGIFGCVALFGKVGNGSFLLEKVLIGCKAIVFYLEKFLWPSGLSVLYPYTQSIAIGNPDLFIPVIVVACVTIATVFAAWRWEWKSPLLAWMLFLLFLLPSFTNMAKGENAALDVYFASDRYAYLAMLGPLLCVGVVFEHMRKAIGGHAWGVASLLLLILSIVASLQSLVWKDSLALFSHVLSVYPNSYVAHVNVGKELYDRGNKDEALREFGHALEIRDDATADYDVGMIFLEKGQTDNARLAFEKAVNANPEDVDALLALAAVLRMQGDATQELRVLESAATLPTATPVVFQKLGDAYEKLHRTAEAAAAYAKAR